MLTLSFFLLLSYLVGSAGLYLFSTSLRTALHTSATGNTSVLNGLRHADRPLAIANLLVELGKPVMLVWIGRYGLGLTDPAVLLWGVVAALAGRMLPLYLHGRHGGKGTLTVGMGTLAVFPQYWWVCILIAVCVLVTSKRWPRFYRPLMSTFYLALPAIGYAVGHPIAVVIPIAVGMLMTLIYGRFRAEDGDQGFEPLYKK